MEARYIVRFDDDFPRHDVEALADELMTSGVLAPGFVPPSAGLLNLGAIVYAKDEQGFDTVVLPDRNLVSRMARVARDGHADLKDKTSRTALALMAFCQAMNLDFEPSVAFHELGVIEGNEVAREELAWFRAADNAAAREWIGLAMGQRSRVDLGDPPDQVAHDFASPPPRWRRNYVVALKVAELELSTEIAPIDRALALIDWMYNDFIVAGPAAVFASMYLGPLAAKKRLFKNLRSKDREKAIRGIQNAAWDMTHLSDFVRRARTAEQNKRRYIFASGDHALVRMASRLFLQPEPADGWPSFSEALAEWWSAIDARRLAEAVFDRMNRLQASDRPWPDPSPDFVADLTMGGEQRIRAWSP